MKSLQDSKKVLIATAATPTFDQYAAVFSIASALKEFSAKEIHLGIAGKLSGKFKEALSLGEMKILTTLPPKKFLLEFKDQKNVVKNIQWNQETETVKFFVTMEKGNFKEGLPEIKTLGSDYETIILVGVNSVMELGPLFSESKEIFEEANIIAIGGQVKDPGLKIQVEYDDKHLSICEDTFYFLNKNNIKISPKGANALLSGIFFATKNFKKNLNDAKTFLTSAELIRKGATNQEAQGIVEKIKSGEGTEGKTPEAKSIGSNSSSSSSTNNQQGQNPAKTNPQPNQQAGSGYKPMQNTSNQPQAPERARF